MQMRGICISHVYADVRHMDMLRLCVFLSFSAGIRKKAVPDLCRQTVPQRGVVNDGVWFDTKEPERGQGGMSEKYELSVQIFPERIRPLNSRK